MTGPEHYIEAERLAARADRWENADMGWKASLSVQERLTRRANDLAAGQLHATLAAAAANALAARVSGHPGTGMPAKDAQAWYEACGTRRTSKVRDGENG